MRKAEDRSGNGNTTNVAGCQTNSPLLHNSGYSKFKWNSFVAQHLLHQCEKGQNPVDFADSRTYTRAH
jgi:hypothetical protein